MDDDNNDNDDDGEAAPDRDGCCSSGGASAETAKTSMCPACRGVEVLSNTVGQTANAVAVSSCPMLRKQFELLGVSDTSSFRVCAVCQKEATRAVVHGRQLYP
jgi:hypothetical protein